MNKYKKELKKRLNLKLDKDYPYLPYQCSENIYIEGTTLFQLGDVGFIYAIYYNVIDTRIFIGKDLSYNKIPLYDVDEDFLFDTGDLLKTELARNTAYMKVFDARKRYAVCFDKYDNITHILFKRKGF